MSTRDIRASGPIVETPLTPAPVTGGGPVGTRDPAEQAVGQKAQLFYELQVLQNEVQQLRGVVEDQAYEISRLRDLQRSQYLDIDRRLTEDGRSVSQLPAPAPTVAPTASTASTAGNPVTRPVRDTSDVRQVGVPVVQTAGSVATAPTEPVPVVEPVVQPVIETTATLPNNPPETPVQPTSQSSSQPNTQPVVADVQPVSSEKVAFERAFELMKDQQFEQSINAYQQVVEGYPDGNYAPESRYWLGELYLMSDRLEAARGSFVSVVEVYPAHQKVPLSLYKLGVVNHRLGATPVALEYLDNVVTRYPDTPAAGLARTYAAELR